MTLAVTGAPDSHRGPIFLADPDGQRGPDSLTGFSVGFRTHFVAYVMVSVASAWVLALTGLRPAGPETPKGAHTLSAPWLRPCPLGHVPAGRICKLKFCKLTTWSYSWQALRGSVSCGRGLHKISLVISALRGRRESGKTFESSSKDLWNTCRIVAFRSNIRSPKVITEKKGHNRP